MKQYVVAALALIGILGIGTVQASSEKILYAHYYLWYGAPPHGNGYRTWGWWKHNPPEDITSHYYPTLGPYDSRDPEVLKSHMEWMKQAGIDVVLIAWWGQPGLDKDHGSHVDGIVPNALDAAQAQGLKVAFMIDAYQGRNSQRTVDDIRYIYRKYGSHPAFYRQVRPTRHGPSTKPRGVFFVWHPVDLGADPGWPKAIDSLRNTHEDAIVILIGDGKRMESGDAGWLSRFVNATHADGLFNYGHRVDYKTPYPKANDFILIPAVIPGFDNTRAYGGPSPARAIQSGREQGAFYDRAWSKIVEWQPEAVSIVSFNEWHESSQIEPAKPAQMKGITYQDYEGHYGRSGSDAASAYLVRTAEWAAKWKGSPPPAELRTTKEPVKNVQTGWISNISVAPISPVIMALTCTVEEAQKVTIAIVSATGEILHAAGLVPSQPLNGKSTYIYTWNRTRMAQGEYLYVVEAERGGEKLKQSGKFKLGK